MLPGVDIKITHNTYFMCFSKLISPLSNRVNRIQPRPKPTIGILYLQNYPLYNYLMKRYFPVLSDYSYFHDYYLRLSPLTELPLQLFFNTILYNFLLIFFCNVLV